MQFKLQARTVEKIKKKDVSLMTLINLILLSVTIRHCSKTPINGDGPKAFDKSIHFFGPSSKQYD